MEARRDGRLRASCFGTRCPGRGPGRCGVSIPGEHRCPTGYGPKQPALSLKLV